jgi:hypothetical protein
MPASLAIARPVQWVATPGGSAQVIATTRATVSAGNGGVPGGLVLSRKRPVVPASAKRHCQRQTAGRLTPTRLATSATAKPVRRQQHDLCPLDVFVAVVARLDDRLEPDPIVVAHDHRNLLCHVSTLAQTAAHVNPLSQSVH